jgi:glycosyltransferase involved in cell wall biosynthesis/CDP-glycerol glycerophosphotransferase (TagB/SpsB family)
MFLTIIIILNIFHPIKGYLFSVIISIHNTARYLDDSIGSLINQTIGIDKIQIILVNDGSTDNSEYICLKYSKKYIKNLIYIKIAHRGVSRARNIGLSHAKGAYINFLDSDDKWDYSAFKNVHLFFRLYNNIDLVGGRIKYFESSEKYHFLDYKFNSTRIVNLTKEYNCIQLSASSSFFRISSIRGEKFEEDIFSGEDIRFIGNILLKKSIIGLIKGAIYFYRKRADSTSAIQNTERKKDYYFSTINFVQQYLIDKSVLLYNTILPFIQYYIAYEVLFRISSKSYIFLDLKSYKKYCNIIENLIKQIDEKYFLEQKIFSSRLKLFALSKKYNRDIRSDLIFKNESFIYSNYTMLDLNIYKKIIVWKNFEIKGNKLLLEGEDRCLLEREKYLYYCQIGNKTFFPKYYYYSGYDFITMFGTVYKGRVISYDITLQIDDEQNLNFYMVYLNSIIEIFPSFGSFTHLPPIKNSYYVTKNFILCKNNKTHILKKYDSNLEMALEAKFCLELKKKHKEHLIKLRQKYKEGLNDTKITDKIQIWLINDRKDQAGDNGEYFFRYLSQLKPKRIQFYFVIKRNCFDYSRLKIYNNIIDLNSTFYLSIFLKADKIISSISESWVNNPFGEEGNYISDLYNFDFIYLQNGIIKDDLSQFLNKIVKNFCLIFTSSTKEYRSFLNFNYGYNENNIALTGLARFDGLKRLQKNIKKENIILIFPTWRMNIKGTVDLITHESIQSENFKNSTYFNFYNNLINNQQLLNAMEKNNYIGLFCLHPNFAEQWRYFSDNKLFKIHKKCYNQELFVKTSLLITDYSSIFFDFGYIQKPIIYTQFDYSEFRKIQYKKGFFDYEKDGFGPVCYNMQCALKTIISEIENNCILKKQYKKRIKRFFKYFDDRNSYRTYIEIMKYPNKNKFLKKPKKITLEFFFAILLLKIFIKKLYIYFN